MGKPKKTLEEMDVMDDFLVNAVALDQEVGEEFCRLILETLLQRQIGKIHITAQKTLQGILPEKRGIRMDVEILEGEDQESGVNIYDLEPHLRKDMNVPKHNRFYQAVIDSRQLASGEREFDKLPNLYIVTILNYDIFGKGYMKYCVHNHCEEVPEVDYEDGLTFLYFNTGGTRGGNEAIHALLTYLQDSRKENVVDEATDRLHRLITKVKEKPEVRLEYMKFEDIIYWEKKDSYKEGLQDGRQEGETAGRESAYKEMIISLLETHGEVPSDLKDKINAIEDTGILERLVRQAASMSSTEAFEAALQQCSSQEEQIILSKCKTK